MKNRYVLASALGLLLPTMAAAQDSRAEEIAAKQREKAAKAHPYQPTRFEKVMGRLEESFTSPPNGWYPAFGNVYSGGGFAVGPGFRQFYGRDAIFDLHGLYSIRGYKLVEASTRRPWHGRGRYEYELKGGWLDATQIAYYGIGMNQTADRGNYRLSRSYATFNAGMRPTRWTRLSGEVGFDGFETKEGLGRAPSIETIYSPGTAPGLGASPSYLRTQATAAIDWRTSPSYSAKGGYYGVTLINWADTSDDFSFKQVNGEVIQHIPLLYGNWVISLRGRVQSVLGDDDTAPYFLLPQLGSGSTLRGYPTGRFRDRNSLLTSAEFRWVPNRLALDMAIFYDAGKVAPRFGDLDFKDLESSWGVGARFHTPAATFLRIEAARPKTGKWRLVFSTGAAF